MTPDSQIKKLVADVARRYPDSQRQGQLLDVDRHAWHLSVLARHVPLGSVVADVGGGLGLMSPSLAAAGYRSILVDDFNDSVNDTHALSGLGVHEDVEVVSVDASAGVFPFRPNSLDAVLSFESIEHWHRSPKLALHALMTALKPGGLLFFSAPNCVDLRKRLTVPFGHGKWSTMDEWYEKPVFRAHVRELDVADLRYIARDLDLQDWKIMGRQWNGTTSHRAFVRGAVRGLDRLLRAVPSLCSSLYLFGRKGK